MKSKESNARSDDALRVSRQRRMVQEQTNHLVLKQDRPLPPKDCIVTHRATLSGLQRERRRRRSWPRIFCEPVPRNQPNSQSRNLRPLHQRNQYEPAESNHAVCTRYDCSKESPKAYFVMHVSHAWAAIFAYQTLVPSVWLSWKDSSGTMQISFSGNS